MVSFADMSPSWAATNPGVAFLSWATSEILSVDDTLNTDSPNKVFYALMRRFLLIHWTVIANVTFNHPLNWTIAYSKRSHDLRYIYALYPLFAEKKHTMLRARWYRVRKNRFWKMLLEITRLLIFKQSLAMESKEKYHLWASFADVQLWLKSLK